MNDDDEHTKICKMQTSPRTKRKISSSSPVVVVVVVLAPTLNSLQSLHSSRANKAHRNSKSQMSLEQHPVAFYVCVFEAVII
jgi:intracellular sulfur oxidation DsrE/DsrF family protein